jgi:biopolymer transport protein TolR
VKDLPLTLDELARQLTLSAQANPETEVLLRADKSVPYGRIVEVMGAAQKAGLNRIGFVADVPTAKP